MNYTQFKNQIEFYNYGAYKYEWYNHVYGWVYSKRLGIQFIYLAEVKPIILKLINFHNQNVLLGLNKANDLETYFQDLYKLSVN